MRRSPKVGGQRQLHPTRSIFQLSFSKAAAMVSVAWSLTSGAYLLTPTSARSARPANKDQAASTKTISLSSSAVTRKVSTSLMAAPSRAPTRWPSIVTAPVAGTR
jgi:hypothetical protein